jgi:hypothetical protein
MVVEDDGTEDALVVYLDSGIDHRSRRPLFLVLAGCAGPGFQPLICYAGSQ